MPDPEEQKGEGGPDCDAAIAHLVVIAPAQAAAQRDAWLDDCHHAWVARVRACVVAAADLAAAQKCGATSLSAGTP
jgi:hypothetical protein